MASTEDICNEALTLVGEGSIGNITDSSPAARACLAVWDSTRREVLYAFGWHCATRRINLHSPKTGGAVYLYTNAFALPADYIRVMDVENNVSFRVEADAAGDHLLCNEAAINIRYLADVPVGQFTPGLVACVALRLASKIAYRLTKNRQLGPQFVRDYGILLRQVMHAESTEGEPIHNTRGPDGVESDTPYLVMTAKSIYSAGL